MSISTSDFTLFPDLQQKAQTYLSSKYPTSNSLKQVPAANPNGTISQSYQTQATVTENDSYSYDPASLTASSKANTGDGARLQAVAQAIKAATPVDTATGLQEIGTTAKASLTQALKTYFSGLLDAASSNQSTSGGLTQSDLNTAVASAVQQFTSGQGLSLSVSATKAFQTDDSVISPGLANLAPSIAVQGVTLVKQQQTLSLTLSADGSVSGHYGSTRYQYDQGTATEQGVPGADATLNSSGWLSTYYGVGTTGLTPLQVYAEAKGGQESQALSISFGQQNNTAIQAATAQGQQPSATTTTLSQKGLIQVASTYGHDGFASSEKIALATLTNIAQSKKDNNEWTIQLSATTTVGVGVSNSSGTSAFVYSRPNGSLGRIDLNSLNTIV